MNCLHSFRPKNKLESHEKVCDNKDFAIFWYLLKTLKLNLEFNQYGKSDKAPFIAVADLECVTEKIDGCKNNPQQN